MSFATIDKRNNGSYLKLLSAISQLSGLFSDSTTPLINYRVAENIFCKSFNSINLSRSDTAFDANYKNIGVGLKTFICHSKQSFEKVAEFNQLSSELVRFQGIELACKLAEFRNKRIQLALRTYGLKCSLYHIVARRENELVLFETDYDTINKSKIVVTKQTVKSIKFTDGVNEYSYNFSKSTLYRKFKIPQNHIVLPIKILDDPFDLILDLATDSSLNTKRLIKGIEYVILPLYGNKKGNKFVFPKSGLNQWNAGGRKRDFGEIYIPVPKKIHKHYPKFFPKRDEKFNLKVPTGEIFRAKLCQDGAKALMTDPNKALSDWLLRKVLNLKAGELTTIEKLEELGFDSVLITKIDSENYCIDIMNSNSYKGFWSEN